jgi:DNA-binding NarL/FixJ family response regulator
MKARPRVAVVVAEEMVGEALCCAMDVRGYDATLTVAPQDDRMSPAQLVRSVSHGRPRVALVGHRIGAPGAAGEVVRGLTEGGAGVIVLSANLTEHEWAPYLAAGARAVVPYLAGLGQLFSAVRATANGTPVISRAAREAIVSSWHRHAGQHAEVVERLNRLSPRERAVLEDLMAGRTVSEIARRDVVSVATVRTQVKSILTKLGVQSQLAAVGMVNNLRLSA